MVKRATRGLGLKNPIIGWKKTRTWKRNGSTKMHLVMLQIMGERVVNGLEYASYSRSEKCRTSKALVLAQFCVEYDYTGRACVGEMFNGVTASLHDHNFKYRVGEIVQPTLPFNKSDHACESGIHYFEDPQDALSY